MDAHIADTTKTKTAAAIQPPVQPSTPDLWNMYPAIDRDDILKAIWIDGALKDVPHEWMPAGWPCKDVLTYSLTDDVESTKDFASRLSQFCKAHADISGVPCRVVLCVRRGLKRSELCYHVAVGATESATRDGAKADATGAVDTVSTESASRVKGLDTKAHVDDATAVRDATMSSVRTGIAEVAAAFGTLLAAVPREWVSDRSHINADCGHLIRAPAGTDGAALRRATAEAISNHVYTVIGASGGRAHRLAIHGTASHDGKQIEFFYEILPVAPSHPGRQAPTTTVCKASVPVTDCPAPSAAAAATTTPLETVSQKSQTAVEILTLYPKLSMVQAADVLSAEIALGDVPHCWVKDGADTDARLLCSHDLSMDGIGYKVQACLCMGWQCAVLSVSQKESDRTIVTISGPRPSSSPKTQTIDDLLDLYPTLSAREAICLTKVVEGLTGIPTEWVDQGSGHTYDDDSAFGDASKMIAHVREAFAKPTDETRLRHVVLTLHRDAAELRYHFVILPRV
ncbi:hypothetical protein pqer_cds_253 [Pandoravirus quercus]|uniref:DUF5860 domain-containing protein n=1 Tax=Pandoravirus quercus TaxID=2107709 RepID=A0A2U7U8G4_9VIRU|nr:hypothetical protein pqer_cds_253 [Pandoravirus quercus]AVK74675.1 hypothetical protein pqer_cds_253 [Pandoravirus quercus]